MQIALPFSQVSTQAAFPAEQWVAHSGTSPLAAEHKSQSPQWPSQLKADTGTPVAPRKFLQAMIRLGKHPLE